MTTLIDSGRLGFSKVWIYYHWVLLLCSAAHSFTYFILLFCSFVLVLDILTALQVHGRSSEAVSAVAIKVIANLSLVEAGCSLGAVRRIRGL